MDERDFQNSKTGRAVLEPKGMYYRFEPNPVPLSFEVTDKIIKAIQETFLALGELKGFATKLSTEEAQNLAAYFIIKEATLSSEIEGTRATLAEVYKEEKQKQKDTEKALDIIEIRNYAKAFSFALDNSSNGITGELIRQAHKTLLAGVRGYDKDPGKYKITQNAIGGRLIGSFEDARFVPASPETTPSLMRNFIRYINEEDKVSALFRIAIAHYQFESIHPFRDGNGRIGRLLITLMLNKAGLLPQPLIYISEYFNRYRAEYTDLLYEVSAHNKLEAWILFFLKALEIQARASFELAVKLENYKEELQKTVGYVSRSPYMSLLLNMLFKNPYIRITDVAKALGMSTPGASRLLYKLVDEGILDEITGKKAGKLFVAKKILQIYEPNRHY